MSESLRSEVAQPLIAECRARLAEGQQALVERYERTGNSRALLHGRSKLVDATLGRLWQGLDIPGELSLAAVGGYGRGELYPCSDVDLLLLIPAGFAPTSDPRVEQLIGMLWDVGLEVGHSVRTIEECVEAATHDVTIQTTLLESRLLAGSKALFGQLKETLAGSRDAAAFFKAKQFEQGERYARFNDTPYALEPNCKESPGGLRDLQVIVWVASAAGLGASWGELADQDLLTHDEARQVSRAEGFLRQLRIRLHLLARRKEDRLLFDYQEALARAMGCAPAEGKRASEVLMQRYFRNAKLVTQLNTLVLQNLGDRLAPRPPAPPIVIDSDFQTMRERLDIRDADLFETNPSAILRSFLILEQRGELKGMTTRTLRALWRARDRVDAAFRRDPENRRLFLKLFQQTHLVHEIRRMNQYDILGRYLPAFGRIVGQMQHDLFHVYTVDQHILQVMRNLRRFTMPEFAHEYPFCSRLMSGFERRWLLYIAALFHDIAKGRGGDHSKLGMEDAREFCVEHALDREDAELIVFLVEHHLTMSQIAQKHDLADPDVIDGFAAIVGTQRRLTALYLLTVADVRGTSPKVWNVWKGKLLEDLFRLASRRLRGEESSVLSGVAENQEAARALLRRRGLRTGTEAAFWQHLDTVYFMRHDADEIAWHTRNLYYRPDADAPIVKARLSPIGAGLQVMVYVPDQPDLFARLCGFFARHGYSIVDAKIHTTRNGYALDSFVILDSQEHLPYRDMIALIEHDLAQQLQVLPPLEPPARGRVPRQVKHFPLPPAVDIRADEKGNRFVMSITTADRPGLLYTIARILGRHGVAFHTAKVATLGERVEDTFLISGKELEKSANLVHIEEELLEALQT